jgi:hypothetical protein
MSLRKQKLFILTHNELGDIVNQCGMIRFFSTKYEEVMIGCRTDFLKQIAYMFEDNKKITFYPTNRYAYDGSELIPSTEMDKINQEYEVLRIGIHSPLRPTYDFSTIPFTFYEMANIPYKVFWDNYYFRETDESTRLYNLLKAHNIDKYVFYHSTISTFGRVIDGEDIKYKLNLDYNDILFICTDFNIYSKDHKFYNIANEFVMKYIIDYTKTIENASYVILSDSCIFCMSLHIPIKTKECYYANCRLNTTYSYIYDEKHGFNSQKGLPFFKSFKQILS